MNNHGERGKKGFNMDDDGFDLRLRALDRRTTMRYIQYNDMHIAALKGHPLYQDASVS